MIRSQNKFAILIAILVVSYCAAHNGNTIENRLKQKAYFAISRFLLYMKQKYELMPIDTTYELVGIRESTRSQYPLFSKLADEIIQKDIPVQQEKFGQQYEFFSKLLLNSKFVKPLRKVLHKEGPLPSPQTQLPTNAAKKQFSFNEKESDICIKRVLDCSELASSATNSCFNRYLNTNTRGYVTTHQLLYFLYLHKSCAADLISHHKDKKQASITAMRQLVANLMYEHEHKKDAGSDLWGERIVVAHLLGYNNLITPQAVRTILSSQTKQGCWPRDFTLATIEENVATLMDTDSGDECSFHKSGLLAWVLSVYLSLY